MRGGQYLKDQLPVLMINLLGMLALALFLMANGNGLQIILFILAVWLLVLVLCMLSFYYSRKKYLNRLLDMAEQLEERYLLPEVMEVPERADDQVFYQLMKMTEKSMLPLPLLIIIFIHQANLLSRQGLMIIPASERK